MEVRSLKFLLILFLIWPSTLLAALDYDLSISNEDISLSRTELVTGDTIRVYASIKNFGTGDVSAFVTFFQGSEIIGDSQIVSVKAGGVPDEVFVDWQPEKTGSYNFRAELASFDPKDQDPYNNYAQSGLFVVDEDTDGDGLGDDVDSDDDGDSCSDADEILKGTDTKLIDTDGDGTNDCVDACPLDSNEQYDHDGDSICDIADTDDDNDGCSDIDERKWGTNPKRKDTNGDGIFDCREVPQVVREQEIKPAQNIITEMSSTQSVLDEVIPEIPKNTIDTPIEVVVDDLLTAAGTVVLPDKIKDGVSEKDETRTVNDNLNKKSKTGTIILIILLPLLASQIIYLKFKKQKSTKLKRK